MHSPRISWSNVRHDLFASVVVFLVALPLCMGIAIASNAPVSAGLITGIVAGLVTGLLAGCPLQVSGPAAGLTVLVFDVVQRFGLESLGLVVLLAGAMQIAAWALSLGLWFRAVSPAVVRGMLAGIGVLIVASQFHVMLDDKPRRSGLENLVALPEAIAKAYGSLELPRPATRAEQVAHVKAWSELHRRLVSLDEAAKERIPHFGAPLPAADPIELADLAREQASIHAALLELAAEPDEAATQPVARAALAELRDASQSLLDALAQERVADVLPAQARAVQACEGVLASLKHHHWAAALGLLSIAAIVLWKALLPKSLQLIPAPLAAVLACVGVAAALQLPVLYVEVPEAIWQEIHFPSTTTLTTVPWREILTAALVMAIVASAETLLCCTAVDQMQAGPRTQYNQELLAQGIGNAICGLLGALPMTGVIVRSSANVLAGGRTRLSAILHGVWLLVFVVGLSFLLRLIPTSCLAGILVYTGFKLIDLKSAKQLAQFGRGEVAIYAATLATIVCLDLLSGVLLGIALAAVRLLYIFSHLHISLETEPGGSLARLNLRGAATFLRLPQLAVTLEQVPAGAHLHVDFERLNFIDHACLELLMSWEKQHAAAGGQLTIDWDSLHARVRGKRGQHRAPRHANAR